MSDQPTPFEVKTGSIVAVLEMVEHDLPHDILAALNEVDAQKYVDAEGIARQQLLREAKIPVEAKGLTALAKKLDQLLEVEAGMKPSGEGPEGVTINVSGSASATAQASAVAQPFGGAYAHLLAGGGTSAIGLSGAIMNPRIKPKFIKAAADAVLTYVVIGTGVLDVFGKDFWAQMALEDLDLRTQIDEWLHKRDSGDYITPASLKALVEGVGKLFGDKFDAFLKSVVLLSRQTRALALIGTGAITDIGDEAMELGDLADTVPLLAEELSRNMVQSQMPEQARRLVTMVKELIAILKNSVLQQYGGVVNAPSADEGAIIFLERRFDPASNIANKMRLALAYEAFVAALAECPAPDVMSNDYLKVVAALGARLNNFYRIVAPDKEALAEQAQPFRPPESVAVARAESRFSFSISLRWGRN